MLLSRETEGEALHREALDSAEDGNPPPSEDPHLPLSLQPQRLEAIVEAQAPRVRASRPQPRLEGLHPTLPRSGDSLICFRHGDPMFVESQTKAHTRDSRQRRREGETSALPASTPSGCPSAPHRVWLAGASRHRSVA